MHVPDTFNDALDIRLSEVAKEPRPVWTQGANFSFALGDTVYDTPLAYKVWSEALQHIRTCIQVSQATPVQPPTGGRRRNRLRRLLPSPGRACRSGVPRLPQEFLA